MWEALTAIINENVLLGVTVFMMIILSRELRLTRKTRGDADIEERRIAIEEREQSRFGLESAYQERRNYLKDFENNLNDRYIAEVNRMEENTNKLAGHCEELYNLIEIFEKMSLAKKGD